MSSNPDNTGLSGAVPSDPVDVGKLKDPNQLGGGVDPEITKIDGESFNEFASALSAKTEDAKSGSTPEPSTPAPRVASDDWLDEPSYKDQLSRFPDFCQFRGPYYKVFDLSKVSESEIESFMERCYPESAPQVVIQNRKEQYSEQTDNWKILITYYKIKYRKLLEQSPNDNKKS